MEQLIPVLAENGLAGVIIAALGFATWQLFKAYQDVQEKRIVESQRINEVANQVTNALENLTEIVKSRRG